MKCPNDGATLAIADRSGVEIDYCPDCRGVWLDRGELDKIIDRAAELDNGEQFHGGSAPRQQAGYPGDRRDLTSGAIPQQVLYQDGRTQDPRYQGRQYKKKSWLSEMLDFD